MINTILTGWNFVRVLRLVIGLSALAAYFSEHDSLIGFMGIILAGQAVFNVGCCGINTCNTNEITKKTNEINSEQSDISFEKIN